MKKLTDLIVEWKEDLSHQVIMIMGTPGCGKTYWMEHNGIQFFKNQGIIINPKEMDIDHTLKKFQLIDFPNFCDRVLNYKTITIQEGDYQPHNKNVAWNMFIKNEQERYTELNKSNGGLETNIPDLSKIKWEFVAPWITRYSNAIQSKKTDIFNQFITAMKKEYFNSVFASDFSVRNRAKEEYDDDLNTKVLDTLNKNDCFVAISGAKMKTIDKIANLVKTGTCRIVFLNGSLEKAVGQDAKRDRSGGAGFVVNYHSKIKEVWKELKTTFKDKNIYCMYELGDKYFDDISKYPSWELKQIYK